MSTAWKKLVPLATLGHKRYDAKKHCLDPTCNAVLIVEATPCDEYAGDEMWLHATVASAWRVFSQPLVALLAVA